MPRITQKDSWVSEYRDLLKESFDPRHKWFVGEHRGSIRLEVKDNGKKQTRLLPINRPERQPMPARNPNAAPTLANDKTPGPGVTSNKKTAIPKAII